MYEYRIPCMMGKPIVQIPFELRDSVKEVISGTNEMKIISDKLVDTMLYDPNVKVINLDTNKEVTSLIGDYLNPGFVHSIVTKDDTYVYAMRPSNNYKGYILLDKGESGESTDYTGDDTSVILSAVEYINNIGGGLLKLLGELYITDTISLGEKTHVHGPASINCVGNKDFIVFYNSSMSMIKNMNFCGTGYGTPLKFVCDKPCSSIRIENVYTYNFTGHHIFISSPDRTLNNVYSNIVLENCECELNPAPASDPMILLENCKDATVIQCYAHNSKDAGFAADGRNIHLINCRASECTEGIRMELLIRNPYSGNIIIDGGEFWNNGYGIIMHNTTKYRKVNILNTHCHDNALDGIAILYAGNVFKDVIVSGNLVESNGRSGISVSGVSERILITDNILRNNGKDTSLNYMSRVSILLDVWADLENIIVKNNIIYDDQDSPTTVAGIAFRCSEGCSASNIRIVDNIVSDNITGFTIFYPQYKNFKDVLIARNKGTSFVFDVFSEEGLSVTLGNNEYGEPTVFTTNAGFISSFNLILHLTVAAGDTVYAKVTTVFENAGETTGIIKEVANSGTTTINKDIALDVTDLQKLWVNNDRLLQVKVYGNSATGSSTSALTFDIFGSS